MNKKQSHHNNILFWVALGLLVIGSYAWRLRVFNLFPFSYDEGIHLILGKLWAAGYTPYQEIFVSYPPSFMWSLGVPWQVFKHPAALQLVMTSYALAGVLAVVYLGTVYGSRLAGLVAGLLLSFTPAYFIPSFSIMTEVPSISMAVVAIALAEKYRRGGRWIWILLTGTALGLGLSLKILPYYAGPLVGLMIVAGHVKEGQLPVKILFRDLAILAAGFIVVFFVPALFFNTSALYHQVVGMRLVSRTVEHNPYESNNEIIIEFLFSNAGLAALALYGLVFVVTQNLRRYWLLLIWFALIWLSMYLLVPLRDKHLPIFIPLLTLLAGLAVSHIADFLTRLKHQAITPQVVAMLLAIIIALGMFIWSVPQVIAQNNGQTLEVNVNEERQTAITFIDKIATPNDCVIADNPVFLYQTQRLPPPQLSETSQTRVDTGYLTFEDVVQAIQTHKCQVVAVVTPRFGESIPGLQDWLADHYLGLHAQSETLVYFAPEGALAQSEVTNNYTPVSNGSFGGMVRLHSYHLGSQPWRAGESAYVSLLWQLESPIEGQYVEQITLRHPASGSPVFQMKHPPFEGLFNPDSWQINQHARETFRLDLPPSLPPGAYNLFLSLCPPETGQCLAVNNIQEQNELNLGQINLK